MIYFVYIVFHEVIFDLVFTLFLKGKSEISPFCTRRNWGSERSLKLSYSIFSHVTRFPLHGSLIINLLYLGSFPILHDLKMTFSQSCNAFIVFSFSHYSWYLWRLCSSRGWCSYVIYFKGRTGTENWATEEECGITIVVGVWDNWESILG